ncbi:MAG: hypothetical protein QXU11_09515 [Thermoproteota archaeon]|nr:hypothetical protein [Candidatus Brockarchaeota archaeon]
MSYEWVLAVLEELMGEEGLERIRDADEDYRSEKNFSRYEDVARQAYMLEKQLKNEDYGGG